MNNKTQSPLMIALETGNFIFVDYLINKAKIDINSDISHDGKTLLHYFASKCDQYDLIQALLKLVRWFFYCNFFSKYFLFFSQLMMKLKKWVKYLIIMVEHHFIIVLQNLMNFVNKIK